MSKIKNSGLDEYGAGPFEQQQFGTAGVERVNIWTSFIHHKGMNSRVICEIRSEFLIRRLTDTVGSVSEHVYIGE